MKITFMNIINDKLFKIIEFLEIIHRLVFI
jgi:hypothetical protein